MADQDPAQYPSIDAARELIIARARGPLAVERVPVQETLDRVLAEDVHAAGDVPPFDASAMDGYAVHAGAAERTLRVIGEARAGAPFGSTCSTGEAVRISTGAAVPESVDAVIRQESVRVLAHDTIRTASECSPGENVRRAGEDMRAGTRVLISGMRMTPSAIGVAVSAGAASLLVARRPRVRVVCTGDELREPGTPLGAGEIHNSNGPMLATLCARRGAVLAPTVIVGDDPLATADTLREALDSADVVIITGGVSVGPHDHVREILLDIGVTERMAGIAMQPGRPTWFGTRGPTLVFGLPGNPVSAVVTFALFAGPALSALQAASPAGHVSTARLGAAVSRRPNRERAVCVTLTLAAEGTVATPTGRFGSHLVSTLLEADALAIIPCGDGELAPGSTVNVEPLIT